MFWCTVGKLGIEFANKLRTYDIISVTVTAWTFQLLLLIDGTRYNIILYFWLAFNFWDFKNLRYLCILPYRHEIHVRISAVYAYRFILVCIWITIKNVGKIITRSHYYSSVMRCCSVQAISKRTFPQLPQKKKN